MQNKFNYINGLTHGAYKFRYQQKEKPTYYKFKYKSGICHGIYKFTYGEKEKPIYVEEPHKQYTYWGREISNITNEIKIPLSIRSIQIPKIVQLIKESIKALQKHLDDRLELQESLIPIEVNQDMLLGILKENVLSYKEQLIYLSQLEDYIEVLETDYIQSTKDKHMTIHDLNRLLNLLSELQIAITATMCLSIENINSMNTHEHFITSKPKGTVHILEYQLLYNDFLKYIHCSSLKHLGRVNHKSIEDLEDLLLNRQDAFELEIFKNASHWSRVTYLEALKMSLQFLGTKKRVNNSLIISKTFRAAHKYLRCHIDKYPRMARKVLSCRLDQAQLVERKIYKETLIETYMLLKRIILKDMLISVHEASYNKLPTKELLKQYLECYTSKLTTKEVKHSTPEIFLVKYMVYEIAHLVHEQLVDCLQSKELIQHRIEQSLVKLQDAIRNLELEGDAHIIKSITKYPLFLNALIKMLEDDFREITTDIESFVTKTFRDFYIQEVNPINSLPKDLEVEEAIPLNKELMMYLEESEQNLKLYKRFWIVGNSHYKDLLILPDHDHPYENEPIIEDIELMPENYHVVYPNEFYKCIDKHPIPNGKDLAPDEIGVSINILIDLINIFIMMWCKFTPAFWGWTGTQAVLGMVDSIYEFITLETSREEQIKEDVKEQYDRAYKWLRWEGEQMALKARYDTGLRGNYYVGLMLEELIYYMVDHHFDVLPLFEDVNKMDEWRTMFDRDVNKDIKFVLDKVKGIRHKILEKEVRPYES